jgi:hypothetical protein
MKKILTITILILLLLPITSSAPSFKGNLPYINTTERYEDPLHPSSELTRYIYTVFSKPYSLSWLEEYVDSEMRPTFLLYHQKDISLLTETPIIGIITHNKESYSIVRIDFEGDVTIESMWRKNESNKYVMFSLIKII